MITFHRPAYRVRGRQAWARYLALNPPALRLSPDRAVLPLPAHLQLDGHSCGFLAALAVAHALAPHLDHAAVLAAVRPTASTGCSPRRLVRALARLGVIAHHPDRLDLAELFRHTRARRPVIVTVRSAFLGAPHWAVVRAVDRAWPRVWLTNHGVAAALRGLPEAAFLATWRPAGEGYVCTRPK